MSDLPLDTVQVKYYPTSSVSYEDELKVDSYIYRSISLFMRNCLFGNSEVGKIQLDLLENNYGRDS